MTEARKKVVIGTPTLTRPFDAYLAALEASVPALDAAGIDHSAVFEVGNPYISNARSTILRKALDAKADAIVFIDHDMSWRPEDLVKLIETDGDVVSGLYRFKKPDVPEEFMGVLETEADGRPILREDGCIKGRRIPAGFMKVTSGAVDRFMSAYPELCYGPRYCQSVDLFNHGVHERVFWGEDYAFSRNWIDAGGEIWVIPDLDLTHHSADAAYPGNYHRFLQRCPGGALDPQRTT